MDSFRWLRWVRRMGTGCMLRSRKLPSRWQGISSQLFGRQLSAKQSGRLWAARFVLGVTNDGGKQETGTVRSFVPTLARNARVAQPFCSGFPSRSRTLGAPSLRILQGRAAMLSVLFGLLCPADCTVHTALIICTLSLARATGDCLSSVPLVVATASSR